MKTKTAQEAFIEQTYGSLENARKQDNLADQRDTADKSNLDMLLTLGRAYGDNTIQGKIDIPTKSPNLKPDNSQYKSCFNNYDHSLEKTRIKIKKGINDDSDVEWGEFHDPEIGNWEIGK